MKGAKPSELKVIQGGIVDVPTPPKTLPKDAHADWNTVCGDLAERKLLTEAALGIIEVYCRTMHTIRECYQVIDREGIFVRTKTSVKPNPASSMLQKSLDVAARLSVELGLTPSARSRKGLSGPAKDDDDGMDEFIG